MDTLGSTDSGDDPTPRRTLARLIDLAILAMLATAAVAALLIVLL